MLRAFELFSFVLTRQTGGRNFDAVPLPQRADTGERLGGPGLASLPLLHEPFFRLNDGDQLFPASTVLEILHRADFMYTCCDQRSAFKSVPSQHAAFTLRSVVAGYPICFHPDPTGTRNTPPLFLVTAVVSPGHCYRRSGWGFAARKPAIPGASLPRRGPRRGQLPAAQGGGPLGRGERAVRRDLGHPVPPGSLRG